MRKPGQIVRIAQVSYLDSESGGRFIRRGIRDQKRLQIIPQLDQARCACDSQ